MQIRKLGILLIVMLACIVYSCTKSDTNTVLVLPESVSGFTTSASTVVFPVRMIL